MRVHAKKRKRKVLEVHVGSTTTPPDLGVRLMLAGALLVLIGGAGIYLLT